MANKYATLFKWINVLVDYILLNGTLYFSFVLAKRNVVWLDVYDYRLTILLLNFCWFYSSTNLKIYSYILTREAARIMNANVACLCIFIVLAFVIKLIIPHLYVPPTPFIYYFALFPFFILSWRLAFLFIRKYKRQVWLNTNKIAIVGAGTLGIDLYKYIDSNNLLGYKIAGIFDNDSSKVPVTMNYLGNVAECISYACTNNVKEIFCALPYKESENIELLLQEADKHMVRFRLIPNFKDEIKQKFLVEMFGSVPVIKPRMEPLENKANEILKRIFDIVFSLLVIITLLSWLLPVLAILIKLDSKGPVFFKQLRSGKRNKSFYCLKLRSMYVNKDSDILQATKNDSRVTRVGKFLRNTSLDELPQFLNVLLGNMSVVGPRPHMLKQTHDYSKVINNYMVRHFLTPGITGWAQINGFRGETKENASMLNRIQADLWYLENWSIFLDLKIIFRTLWHLLKNNNNAY